MPFFQNCGMDATARQSGALFVGEKEPECLSPVVDCGPKAQYLEITIDTADPSSFVTTSPFTVYGRCNAGNYPYNGIRYRIYLAANPDVQPVDILRKSEDYVGNNYNGHCLDGRYAIELNPLGEGTAFILEVQMIGYSQRGTNGFVNNESMGRALLDLSFFLPPTP